MFSLCLGVESRLGEEEGLSSLTGSHAVVGCEGHHGSQMMKLRSWPGESQCLSEPGRARQPDRAPTVPLLFQALPAWLQVRGAGVPCAAAVGKVIYEAHQLREGCQRQPLPALS